MISIIPRTKSQIRSRAHMCGIRDEINCELCSICVADSGFWLSAPKEKQTASLAPLTSLGILVQESDDPPSKLVLSRPTDLTFPDDHYAPARPPQLPLGPLVSGCISLHLGDPVCAPRRRHSAASAIMHVPKAAIDVDDLAQSWENEIRCARLVPPNS